MQSVTEVTPFPQSYGLLLGLASDKSLQKRDEFCASVAGAGLANDFAAAGMECRVQRQGAMTVILKAVSFGPARGQGQNRVQAVKRLEWRSSESTQKTAALSVGFPVKSNDIGCLLFKLRVGAGHVAPESIGLNPGASPDAGDSTVRNAQMPRQFAGAPMSRTVRRWFLSSVENPGFLADDLLGDNFATMPGVKAPPSARLENVLSSGRRNPGRSLFAS